MEKDAWINVSAAEKEEDPVIVLDDNVVIGPRTQISAKNYIHIERDTLVGSSVLIQDHNHAYEDITKPIADQPLTEGGRIRIREGSWIGSGSVIMCAKGELIVGRHCVVGANSVVLRSCPPYSVVFGNPARVVRFYDLVKNKWTLGSGGSTDSELDQ
jgi:acetyltransferase-like isoleucine patch superfamily enzyme